MWCVSSFKKDVGRSSCHQENGDGHVTQQLTPLAALNPTFAVRAFYCRAKVNGAMQALRVELWELARQWQTVTMVGVAFAESGHIKLLFSLRQKAK
jgi:hypothetical protein